MNSSPGKSLVEAQSPRRTQAGDGYRNWTLLILVIIPLAAAFLFQFLRTSDQEPYVFFPVYSRESHEETRNTNITSTRRLLAYEEEEEDAIFPPWDPHSNTWQVRRQLMTEELLLYVSLTVADVTYVLDLDFRAPLVWVNCKWTPKDHRGAWNMFVEKLKPSQLHGPNGLYVPKLEIRCDTLICSQLNLHASSAHASCGEDHLCHFGLPYGEKETLEGVLTRDDVVLSNSSVPVNDKHYRRMDLVFGCIHKRRSKATGKRMKYKEKLGSDGVLGLSEKPLSFPSQLYQRKLADKSIILCLAKTKGVIAGYIVFGFDVKRLGDFATWVPLEHGAGGTYQVQLRNIKYGDEVVMLGHLLKRKIDIIIDGSLRFTYLEKEIFEALVKIVKRWARKNELSFQDHIDGQEGTCWIYDKATIKVTELRLLFKNVHFLFGSPTTRREMMVRPKNFLVDPAEGLVCLAIRSSEDIKQPGVNILGGTAMKERMILLDKVSDRFGWADDDTCKRNRLAKLRDRE